MNFIKKTEYRLFNINWKNEASENINIIRNFDGSEEQMIRASATCTVTRSKDSFYYDNTNKATNLVVNFSF